MTPVFQFAPDAFDTRIERPMGRQHAGHGFLRAAVAGREGPVVGMGAVPGKAGDASFVASVRGIDPAADVAWIEHHDVARLAGHEVLHLPAPGLAGQAALRSRLGAAAWSLSAITHTIASDRIMAELAALPTSHAQPWDALICTSEAVRGAVDLILDHQEEFLRRRLGAAIFPRPLRPVIPLGIHVGDFAPSPARRQEARLALGIAEDEVVACFLGRLSFHAKAHPAAMYEGLEAAARATGRRVVVLETGWFPNAAIQSAFAEGRRLLCPGVRAITSDGRPQEGRATALAAADIFVSLSDNIQETFGLTPLEAMAAGLPVVVSDWDGYRDTVRDGLDGYRIPTSMPPPGAGERLAALYQRGAITYDLYCCIACLPVAVDPVLLAERLTALVGDADLRRRLGESGRAHVRALYDWSVVYPRYRELWAECTETRLAAAAGGADRAPLPETPAASLDPFALFAGYPSAALSAGTRLALLPAAVQWRLRLANPLFDFALHLAPEGVAAARALMDAAEAGRRETLAETAGRSGLPLDMVLFGAGLLCKMGVARPTRIAAEG